MTFPRYPTYKNSGVEWLGEVPDHWGVKRFKLSIESCVNGVWGEEPGYGDHDVTCMRVADFDRQKLVASEPSEPTIRSVSARDIEQRSIYSGDLLIEKSGGGEKQPVGAVVLYTGSSPAVCSNFVARMRLAPGMNPSFWRYVHHAAYSLRVNTKSIKQTSGIQNLDQQQYLNEVAAYPPSDEQEEIANFLDRETGKIDALIAEQQRLIELLQEKRQSVISHAVTKGLNPNAPMKDSGVEWLGEVPGHWVVTPLRLAARIESGHTPSRSVDSYWVEEECVFPWFTLSDVWQIRSGQADYVYETKERVSQLGLNNSAARLLPKGTVILSRTASVGFAGILGTDMATTQDFVNWICGPKLLPEFLLAVFRGMSSEFERLKYGSTHNTIYMPDVYSFRAALPPIKEQSAIAAEVRSRTAQIDDSISSLQKAVELLVERRSALISAAVTGQIDVRGLVREVSEQ